MTTSLVLNRIFLLTHPWFLSMSSHTALLTPNKLVSPPSQVHCQYVCVAASFIETQDGEEWQNPGILVSCVKTKPQTLTIHQHGSRRHVNHAPLPKLNPPLGDPRTPSAGRLEVPELEACPPVFLDREDAFVLVS